MLGAVGIYWKGQSRGDFVVLSDRCDRCLYYTEQEWKQ